MQRFRKPLAVVGALGVVWSSAAQAEEPGEHSTHDDGHRTLRVGAVAGVGFPQPLAIEPMVELHDRVALGIAYGVLPTVNVAGVETGLWSLSGDARFFPFRGAFFVSVRGGRQHIGARTTVAAARFGSASENLDLDSWFINPRIGFLWTSHQGLTLGVDAGVQIPVASSTASSLPLAFAPGAQHAVDSFGGSWLPTIDLLRVGLLL